MNHLLRLTLMIGICVGSSGCMFASKVFDTNHYRERWISQNEVAPHHADMIRQHRFMIGMSLQEARVACGVGSTFFQLGNSWVINRQWIVTIGPNNRIATLTRYGY